MRASRISDEDETTGLEKKSSIAWRPDRPALRPTIWATHGAVTSGHPLATQAGLRVLQAGGNAMDAAITMAAVLAVVRPHMNGLGGDAFAIFYDAVTDELVGLNASGRSAATATPEAFAELGLRKVPRRGPLSVTVPGAVSGWAATLERFGTLSLAQALGPAIDYATAGFPVSAKLHQDIASEQQLLAQDARAAGIFLCQGQAPPVGTLLRQPGLAASLEMVADQGPSALYGGAIGQAIVDRLDAVGGLLCLEDMVAHQADWVEPLQTDYENVDVAVLPPNSQGMALLLELNLAAQFDIAAMGIDSAETVHHMVEIVKLAFRERDRHVTDADFHRAPLERLLSEEYAARLAATLDPDHASTEVANGASAIRRADTVYLAAFDSAGNMVSWIQSLYMSFGSGVIAGDTGIVLQNRGALFSLDTGDINVVAPRKRTYHTLSPAMVLRDRRPWMAIGTPGGDSQTQTILQVLLRLLSSDLDPQAAVEAPRWRLQPTGELLIEDAFADEVCRRLGELGHRLRVLPTARLESFGGLQLIRVENNSIAAAADSRREATALGW
ncbi:MAG: gamma-glutamyltransferase [Acidobacteriota bacterium]